MSEKQECDIDSTIVEVSDRNFQIIKRSFEVHLKTFQSYLKDFWVQNKNDRYEYLSENVFDTNGELTLKSWKNKKNPVCLHLEMSRNGFDDDDDDDECSYKTLKSIAVRAFIWVNDTLVSVHHVPFEKLTDKPDEYTTYIENLFSETFEGFQLSYEMCKCGKRCVSPKKQCEDCYIKNYVHEENCSICLENNYIWGSLKCGHMFHIHCLKKVHLYTKTKKCPLCRSIWIFEEIEEI